MLRYLNNILVKFKLIARFFQVYWRKVYFNFWLLDWHGNLEKYTGYVLLEISIQISGLGTLSKIDINFIQFDRSRNFFCQNTEPFLYEVFIGWYRNFWFVWNVGFAHFYFFCVRYVAVFITIFLKQLLGFFNCGRVFVLTARGFYIFIKFQFTIILFFS